MKKIFLVLVSLLLILVAYIVEGGHLRSLLIVTSLIPVFLGTFFATWFTFSLSEIGSAFHNAFASRVDPNLAPAYQTDLLVIRSMSAAILYWAFSITILAVIGILSSLTDVTGLGPLVALGITALLWALLTRTLLFVPMESNMQKKLLEVERQAG